MSHVESKYSPLPSNKQGTINKLWIFYKENVGLEGQIAIDLRRARKSDVEIDDAISIHRANREVLMFFYQEAKEKAIT